MYAPKTLQQLDGNQLASVLHPLASLAAEAGQTRLVALSAASAACWEAFAYTGNVRAKKRET